MARSDNDATVIGVSAAVVYDVISATNSSPQTTEINASRRASTLMKWVNIGMLQALLFVVIMTIAEPRGSKWRPLTGGGLAGVLLYAQYVHARNAGLANPGPSTEDTGTTGTTADTTPGDMTENTPSDYQPPFVGSAYPGIQYPRTAHAPTRVRTLRRGR